MFKVGDTVKYSHSGVCRITDKVSLDFSGEEKEYFVLMPVHKKNSTVYVPLDNENLIQKMVLPLSPAEIDEIIKEALKQNIEWIKDFRKRCEFAKNVLASNDRKEVLLLIKSIYAHKRELSTEGKYMHSSDDYILKDAEDILFGEIAFSLGKEFIDVQNYMRNKFGA